MLKEFVELALGLLGIILAFIITVLLFSCTRAEAAKRDADNTTIQPHVFGTHESYDQLMYSEGLHYRIMDAYNVNKKTQLSILNAVYIASEEFGISPDLFIAIIAVESSFKSDSVSNKGAVGLMQVMPSVWGPILQKKGIIESDTDLKGIYTNILAGGFILYTYLTQGVAKYDSEHDIIKYAVFRYLGLSNKPNENLDYYNKVLSILGLYHLYGGMIDMSFYTD